ncbi:hypothetical protein GZ77_26170 [Endozoicomonas montiporae]|uniref:Helicase ATP-binding domain-containing protein n=1 Tax=Endozoicomonas montiporae TaxID=1027273 RepID=A0A081MYH7_9GAMM|nr:DEAD/DEAH box helicase family protein [Endozoicomonas montiporae]KEQ11250.1 hypothetical protein GZ77_26505 [Endozoicomonas montiporae]KEQ11298.1 hypothetical protein GZ77_26170 [Endozoicomonas montiporae]
MLVQRIKQEHQAGSSTVIDCLAKGAEASGFNVAIIVPRNVDVNHWKIKKGFHDCNVMSAHHAFVHGTIRMRSYDFILLDECHRMGMEVDPVQILEELYEKSGERVTIIGTYCIDKNKGM